MTGKSGKRLCAIRRPAASLPVLRRMRLLRYDAPSAYDHPEHSIGWHRIGEHAIGIRAAHGMRRYIWIWRTVK